MLSSFITLALAASLVIASPTPSAGVSSKPVAESNTVRLTRRDAPAKPKLRRRSASSGQGRNGNFWNNQGSGNQWQAPYNSYNPPRYSGFNNGFSNGFYPGNTNYGFNNYPQTSFGGYPQSYGGFPQTFGGNGGWLQRRSLSADAKLERRSVPAKPKLRRRSMSSNNGWRSNSGHSGGNSYQYNNNQWTGNSYPYNNNQWSGNSYPYNNNQWSGNSYPYNNNQWGGNSYPYNNNQWGGNNQWSGSSYPYNNNQWGGNSYPYNNNQLGGNTFNQGWGQQW